MNTTVLGCGRWGTFIADYLDSIGSNTILWGRSGSTHLEQLSSTGKNDYVSLSSSVAITSSIEKAMTHSDMIFISIDSRGLRSLLETIRKFHRTGNRYILCMKGLENETGLRLTQVIESVLGNDVQTAVWVGPGHVENFTNNIPSAMIIDSKNSKLTKETADYLTSSLIRFYYGEDIIGTEIGAASKNVVGIAAGILDGLGQTSLKGALMARAAREYSRLVEAMGGNAETVYGLSHLGDYEATLFSKFSRNRLYGENFALRKPFNLMAEGVSTVKSLMVLSREYKVELPISETVYSILYEDLDIPDGLDNLFIRPLKHEFKG